MMSDINCLINPLPEVRNKIILVFPSEHINRYGTQSTSPALHRNVTERYVKLQSSRKQNAILFFCSASDTTLLFKNLQLLFQRMQKCYKIYWDNNVSRF